jgi:hypothetical protein
MDALDLVGGVDTGDRGEEVDGASVRAYRARVKAIDVELGRGRV